VSPDRKPTVREIRAGAKPALRAVPPNVLYRVLNAGLRKASDVEGVNSPAIFISAAYPHVRRTGVDRPYDTFSAL